jgi:hypothetical protein
VSEFARHHGAFGSGTPTVGYGQRVAPGESSARIRPGTRREIGLVNAGIVRVRDGGAAPGWSERQQQLLAAAEELHADGRIGDDLWAQLSRQRVRGEDLTAAAKRG